MIKVKLLNTTEENKEDIKKIKKKDGHWLCPPIDRAGEHDQNSRNSFQMGLFRPVTVWARDRAITSGQSRPSPFDSVS